MANWYWYEKTGEGAIRLLRVFGTSPEVIIPARLAGQEVVELGAYCFAAKRRVKVYEVCSESMQGEEAGEAFERLLEQGRLTELAGGYIRKVICPEGLQGLGNLCFYQCSKLSELVFGRSLTEIGSDAFMNCLQLQKLTVLGSVSEPTGLRQILGQRSVETEVNFVVEGRCEAALTYPEYSESYDEIGPAHIFTLNIEGEGFRARQCFQNGVVDLAQYDAVFLQACVKESERTLCHMAWMRLYYPVGLREEYKEKYEEYLIKHESFAGAMLVQERNLELLEFSGEQGYLSEQETAECIALAASSDWAEGAGMLLQNQKKWFGGKKKEEYSFDDF